MLGLSIFERRRLKETKQAQVLRLLKKHKVMSNIDLKDQSCFAYVQRIAELRAEGHLILSEHVKGSLWLFHYLGHIDDGAEEAV